MRVNKGQVLSDSNYQSKNVWTIPFVILLLLVLTCILHAWINKQKGVSQGNFEDMSALDQYEWLNYTSEYVEYLKQRVYYLSLKVEEAEKRYVNYENKLSWPVHIRSLYDKDVQPLRHNLKNAIEEYNVMAKEYNLKSRIFKWSAFEDNIQKPPRSFEEIDLKDVGL